MPVTRACARLRAVPLPDDAHDRLPALRAAQAEVDALHESERAAMLAGAGVWRAQAVARKSSARAVAQQAVRGVGQRVWSAVRGALWRR